MAWSMFGMRAYVGSDISTHPEHTSSTHESPSLPSFQLSLAQPAHATPRASQGSGHFRAHPEHGCSPVSTLKIAKGQSAG